MNKKLILDISAFIIGTIFFIISTDYIIENLDVTPITIRGFAALEYVFFYVYTIYDHLKKIKSDGSI